MIEDRATIYAKMADAMERDPISEDLGRATVPMGRGFAAWKRCNPGQTLLSVTDPEGREWFLTPKQAEVYDLARTYFDHGTVKVREMAAILKMAPSTVSRAMVKLNAIGLLRSLIGRGRYGGMVIFARVKEDGLERLRKAAQAKVKAWREAADRRLSRTISIVASRYSWREIEAHGYQNLYLVSMGATMSAPFTAEDVAGVV